MVFTFIVGNLAKNAIQLYCGNDGFIQEVKIKSGEDDPKVSVELWAECGVRQTPIIYSSSGERAWQVIFLIISYIQYYFLLDPNLLEKSALSGNSRSIRCLDKCFKQNITLENMVQSNRYEDFCESIEVHCQRTSIRVILPETGGNLAPLCNFSSASVNDSEAKYKYFNNCTISRSGCRHPGFNWHHCFYLAQVSDVL